MNRQISNDMSPTRGDCARVTSKRGVIPKVGVADNTPGIGPGVARVIQGFPWPAGSALSVSAGRLVLRCALKLFAHPPLERSHVLWTAEKVLDQIICRHGSARLQH